MSGHTPGPWTYFVGNANGRGLIRIETAHDAKPVAGAHIASMARGGVSEANARLMAAAPMLLKAALHCEDMLMRYTIDRIDGEEIADAALLVIRAAIAAATGEKA